MQLSFSPSAAPATNGTAANASPSSLVLMFISFLLLKFTQSSGSELRSSRGVRGAERKSNFPAASIGIPHEWSAAVAGVEQAARAADAAPRGENCDKLIAALEWWPDHCPGSETTRRCYRVACGNVTGERGRRLIRRIDVRTATGVHVPARTTSDPAKRAPAV